MRFSVGTCVVTGEPPADYEHVHLLNPGRWSLPSSWLVNQDTICLRSGKVLTEDGRFTKAFWHALAHLQTREGHTEKWYTRMRALGQRTDDGWV